MSINFFEEEEEEVYKNSVERINGNICRNLREIIRNHKKLFKLGIFGLFVSQFEFFFFFEVYENSVRGNMCQLKIFERC